MLSGSATIRFLASFGNVFLSLILGVIAMGFFLVYLSRPSSTRPLRVAAAVHEWIIAQRLVDRASRASCASCWRTGSSCSWASC